MVTTESFGLLPDGLLGQRALLLLDERDAMTRTRVAANLRSSFSCRVADGPSHRGTTRARRVSVKAPTDSVVTFQDGDGIRRP